MLDFLVLTEPKDGKLTTTIPSRTTHDDINGHFVASLRARSAAVYAEAALAFITLVARMVALAVAG